MTRYDEGVADLAQPLVGCADDRDLGDAGMAQEDLLNRVAGALSTLPVRVLMTTGTGIDRGSLRPAPNTTIRDFVPHQSVLPHVDLVICHAGHGTVMTALA